MTGLTLKYSFKFTCDKKIIYALFVIRSQSIKKKSKKVEEEKHTARKT